LSFHHLQHSQLPWRRKHTVQDLLRQGILSPRRSSIYIHRKQAFKFYYIEGKISLTVIYSPNGFKNSFTPCQLEILLQQTDIQTRPNCNESWLLRFPPCGQPLRCVICFPVIHSILNRFDTHFSSHLYKAYINRTLSGQPIEP
jgi:hypothetical protein